MSKMKLGMQIWSIHDVYKNQKIDDTLKALKEMGYDAVEYALGDSISFEERYGHTIDEANKALVNNDMKALGAHIPFEGTVENPERMIEECKTLGLSYAGIGPIFYGDRVPYDNQKALYEKLAKTAVMFKDNGIQMQIHCSASSYLLDYKGRYLVDGMIEEAGLENLQPEFDTAWMICGQVDPVERLSKYKNHVDILHLKDFHPLKEDVNYLMVRHNTIIDGSKDGCAVGEDGVQNVEAMVNAARENGTKWIFVELWNETDSIRNAKVSAENIKKYL